MIRGVLESPAGNESASVSGWAEEATCVTDEPSCHLCMTDIKGQQAARHTAAKSSPGLIELEQCP